MSTRGAWTMQRRILGLRWARGRWGGIRRAVLRRGSPGARCPRRGGERGQAAVAIALGVVVVMVSVPVALELQTIQQATLVSSAGNNELALQAAAAGIADFQAHLAADGAYASSTAGGYCSAVFTPSPNPNNVCVQQGSGASAWGHADPNNPAFVNAFDGTSGSSVSTTCPASSSTAATWVTTSGSIGGFNTGYQYVVDASQVYPGGSDIAYVYVTGRAGYSGKYSCRTQKAAIAVQQANTNPALTTSNGWQTFTGSTTTSASITLAGAAGGSGTGTCFTLLFWTWCTGGGAGGPGEQITATFAVPAGSGDTFAEWVNTTPGVAGCPLGANPQPGSSPSGGANTNGLGTQGGGCGWASGGNGGYNGGGGGGAEAVCLLSATSGWTGTPTCLPGLPLCTGAAGAQPADMTAVSLNGEAETGCILAVAGGGGGGGESVCLGSQGGSGGAAGDVSGTGTAGSGAPGANGATWLFGAQSNGGGGGTAAGAGGAGGTGSLAFFGWPTQNGGSGASASPGNGGAGATYLGSGWIFGGSDGGGGGGGYGGGGGGGGSSWVDTNLLAPGTTVSHSVSSTGPGFASITATNSAFVWQTYAYATSGSACSLPNGLNGASPVNCTPTPQACNAAFALASAPANIATTATDRGMTNNVVVVAAGGAGGAGQGSGAAAGGRGAQYSVTLTVGGGQQLWANLGCGGSAGSSGGGGGGGYAAGGAGGTDNNTSNAGGGGGATAVCVVAGCSAATQNTAALRS